MIIQSTLPTHAAPDQDPPKYPLIPAKPPTDPRRPALKSQKLLHWEDMARKRGKVKRLHEAGLSMSKIARTLGIGSSTGQRLLAQLRGKVPTPLPPRTLQDRIIDVLVGLDAPVSMRSIQRLIRNEPPRKIRDALSKLEASGLICSVLNPFQHYEDWLYFVHGYWAVRTGEEENERMMRYKDPRDAHADAMKMLAATDKRVRLEYVENWERFDPYLEAMEVAKQDRTEQDSAPEAPSNGYRERNTYEIVKMVVKERERWEERNRGIEE